MDDIYRIVDAAICQWQQGDAIRPHDAGPMLLYQTATAYPITLAAAEVVKENGDTEAVEMVSLEPEHGFAIVTQTCDIVRDGRKRPMIALAPMEVVDTSVYASVVKGKRPSLAAVPGLADERLVANLDYIITVEKGFLVNVPEACCVRAQGDTNERTRFAAILARKFDRFAYPDNLVRAMMPIARHIIDKHGKESELGRALTTLREIRLDAQSSWDAPEDGEIIVLFIHDLPEDISDADYAALETLLEKFVPHGPYLSVTSRISSLTDLSAAAYLRSQPLDLDHLSYR